MKKSPLIYIFILLIWAIVSSVLVWQTVNISLVLFNDRNILLWKKIVGGGRYLRKLPLLFVFLAKFGKRFPFYGVLYFPSQKDKQTLSAI
mgnify:CR=1 FL=1